MRILLFISFLMISLSSQAQNFSAEYQPSPSDLQKADDIARKTAAWFHYTTGPMNSEHLGQCGDYAVMFILKYNEYVGQNVARLVTTNNPIPSGTYRLGEKTDLAKLGFHGFPAGSSGFLKWMNQLYIYHPILGAYPIYLEKSWIPTLHFGVDMLDKRQVHTWASIGNVSVDPTYFAVWPDRFLSPLGVDEPDISHVYHSGLFFLNLPYAVFSER